MADVIVSEINTILIESLADLVPEAFFRSHPFLDRMGKESAGGSASRFPVITGAGGGASATFEDALANANVGGGTTAAFVVPPAQGFGIEIIDWSSEPYTNGEQSPIKMSILASKNAVEKCSDDLASNLLGMGYGVLFTCLTATNTSGHLWDLVLTVPSDAGKVNLEDQLVQKVTPATAGLTTGLAEVVGVNEIFGTVTVDVGTSGMTPTAGYVFGRQGTLLPDTTPTGFQGAFAWCPPKSSRTNGVVGGTFLGVDRSSSSQVVSTSGYAYDGAGAPVTNLIQQVCGVMAARKNAKPDTIYVHPSALPKLAIELDQKVRTDMKDTQGRAGFAGFDYTTAAGVVQVLAESAMPSNLLLICKASNWKFRSPKGKLVSPTKPGQMIIDSYDHNVSRIALTATGFFGNIDMSSVAVITIATPVVG